MRVSLILALVLLSGCTSPSAAEDPLAQEAPPADEPRGSGEPPASRAVPILASGPDEPGLPVPSFEPPAEDAQATEPDRPPGADPSTGTSDPDPEPSRELGPGPAGEPERPVAGPSPAPRPVRFLAGADAPDGKFLMSLTLGPEGTSFDAVLRAVPDATLRIDSLVRLTNSGAELRNVTLSTEQLVDARVVRASLLVAGARVDLRAAEPSITLALAPGDAWDVGLECELGSATPGKTGLAQTVTLTVW